ncbi:hypothetical protein RB25_04280 [Herbaspirillum rubrisubalbicans]|jgi:hypothetical protein|uniref:Lipoprotein n=2 Tax=Oxalobacteraceae TaxID=75682 RepID=A0ABX9BWT7_9BURK|nr:hypothetical protein [Herbaspirillum rubrisubalbicans]RAM62376.1 hypothetical protein RB24_21580 [Herbaspirillum rubrisubalbicans]RAN49600.1 hypothetical protein RB25_04280 [Herbaspirillum rubrisubalbicans]
METLMRSRPAPLPLALTAVAAVLTLALSGCSRSPKEQLAYQHAEEQYQINQRNAELARSRPEEENATEDQRGRERD